MASRHPAADPIAEQNELGEVLFAVGKITLPMHRVLKSKAKRKMGVLLNDQVALPSRFFRVLALIAPTVDLVQSRAQLVPRSIAPGVATPSGQCCDAPKAYWGLINSRLRVLRKVITGLERALKDKAVRLLLAETGALPVMLAGFVKANDSNCPCLEGRLNVDKSLLWEGGISVSTRVAKVG